MDDSLVGEEIVCFFHRHLKDVVDGFPAPFDFESLACVAFSFADIAGYPDVGKEVHLKFHRTCSLAGFASSTLDIE